MHLDEEGQTGNLGASIGQTTAVVCAKDAELESFVKQGKVKMPSVGAKLSEAQIDAVVKYVSILQK